MHVVSAARRPSLDRLSLVIALLAIAGCANPRLVEPPRDAPTDTRPALYTEMQRLDDQRQKGILTEEEFQTEKAKLLNGHKDLIKDQ